MTKLRIAIVGATGMVGQALLKVLQETDDSKIKTAEYFLFASSENVGEKIKVFGKEYSVLELANETVRKIQPDFAFFAAGGDVSVQWASAFTDIGCRVIDNSSAFRQNPDVPLIVPECNPQDIKKNSMLIANPNCSTIAVMPVLKPLDDVYKIKRVVYSTYQAVSGAGLAGIEDYKAGQQGEGPKKFKHRIFNNLIPQIDSFTQNGNTKEEQKMIFETQKILGRKIAVTATCCRVPVENSHSISVNVQFHRKPDITRVREILKNAPGVVLLDDPDNFVYPMPYLANGKDEIFVGRVRLDNSHKKGLNLFAVCDNVRKGAATNAVQILKLLL